MRLGPRQDGAAAINIPYLHVVIYFNAMQMLHVFTLSIIMSMHEHGYDALNQEDRLWHRAHLTAEAKKHRLRHWCGLDT